MRLVIRGISQTMRSLSICSKPRNSRMSKWASLTFPASSTKSEIRPCPSMRFTCSSLTVSLIVTTSLVHDSGEDGSWHREPVAGADEVVHDHDRTCRQDRRERIRCSCRLARSRAGSAPGILGMARWQPCTWRHIPHGSSGPCRALPAQGSSGSGRCVRAPSVRRPCPTRSRNCAPAARASRADTRRTCSVAASPKALRPRRR